MSKSVSEWREVLRDIVQCDLCGEFSDEPCITIDNGSDVVQIPLHFDEADLGRNPRADLDTAELHRDRLIDAMAARLSNMTYG